jgi:hypothetical protein
MPAVGFEPTISAGERPQNFALNLAATGIGFVIFSYYKYDGDSSFSGNTRQIEHNKTCTQGNMSVARTEQRSNIVTNTYVQLETYAVGKSRRL